MRARSLLVLVVGVVSFACGDDPDTAGGRGTSSGFSSGGSSGGSSASSSGAVTSGGGTAAAVCVDVINQYRATKNLPPLVRWTEGEACADGEAQTDATTRKAHGAFGSCKESAQNECPDHPAPPEKNVGGCLELMWGEGPGGGHYENMASTRWKQVACGFATTSRGTYWSVQNYR